MGLLNYISLKRYRLQKEKIPEIQIVAPTYRSDDTPDLKTKTETNYEDPNKLKIQNEQNVVLSQATATLTRNLTGYVSNNTVIAAPGVGNRIILYGYQLNYGSSGGVAANIREMLISETDINGTIIATTPAIFGTAAESQGVTFSFPKPYRLTENVSLNLSVGGENTFTAVGRCKVFYAIENILTSVIT